MSGIPAFGSSAARGLLGVLRSWLQPPANEIRPLSGELSRGAGTPSAHSYGAVRLLVVDDNPANLMVIRAMMASRGLVPMLAADGAEAVALACELRFDLILMDLQMPILDGLGATSAIRRFERSSALTAVPIIAYTSMSPGFGILASHGLSGSLMKPCGDQELEHCLVRWCPTYCSAPAGRGTALHSRGREIGSRVEGTGRAPWR